ncbi:MAG: FAD-dependent oxidoreductase, partial [Elusimicrobia bacterium]|nr:FAD-dependent oxidoreductase [Elusimicrobiota bacterium]
AGLRLEGRQVRAVRLAGGEEIPCSGLVSTAPLTGLVGMLDGQAPPEVRDAAAQLRFRSFLVVAAVLDQRDLFADQWIYIHSPEVKIGRIQNVGNWSRRMVPDPGTTVLGVEYFCDEGDAFWRCSDAYLARFAEEELRILELIAPATRVIDSCVARVPKAYPLYSPGYSLNLRIIRGYLQSLANVQVAGRGGMFKYNNMDHSILTGILAARNLLGGREDVWGINTEDEYHETVREPRDDAR